MTLTAQMNFRISQDLKTAGNRALAGSGITPSDLVRTTWEYLERNRHAPDAITRLLDFLENDGRSPSEIASPESQASSTQSEAERIVMAGPNLIQKYFEELSLDRSALPPLDYEDLKHQAYADKYPQLGGIS